MPTYIIKQLYVKFAVMFSSALFLDKNGCYHTINSHKESNIFILPVYSNPNLNIYLSIADTASNKSLWKTHF